MADNYSICLLKAMDHLWFHQIILFPDPISLLITKTTIKPPLLVSESPTSSSSSLSLSSHSAEEENSPPVTPQPQDDSSDEDKEKERPTRLSHSRSRTRSHSSSPSSNQKRPKIHTHFGPARKLQKSMSLRSLGELELEEVKGFMDLGFTFKKEHLSPRLMSLIPGLQRLGLHQKTKLIDVNEITKDGNKSKQEEDERGSTMKKPYLSEAWLIKRPDSPLLNLRVPRFSAAADMKKHLKFWARIVASEIE